MQKLKLNKEVIATLNDDSMRRVEGGEAAITYNMYQNACASLPYAGAESFCVCHESEMKTRCLGQGDLFA